MYSTKWENGTQQWQCNICNTWVVAEHLKVKIENKIPNNLCYKCYDIIESPPTLLELDISEEEAKIIAIVVGDIDLVSNNVYIMHHDGRLVQPSLDTFMDLKKKMRKMVVDLLPQVVGV